MLTSVHPTLEQKLHETNDRLRFWLDSLVLDRAEPALTKPEQMSGLLSELLRAGEWLRTGLPQERDAELEAEIGEYRRNVECLREYLPFIHRQLLNERARLEGERAKIQSVTEWARGSRQVL